MGDVILVPEAASAFAVEIAEESCPLAILLPLLIIIFKTTGILTADYYSFFTNALFAKELSNEYKIINKWAFLGSFISSEQSLTSN
jgi:hypothetical protein